MSSDAHVDEYFLKLSTNDSEWFSIDFSTRLVDSTISTATWTLDSGITNAATSNTTTVVKIRLSGGTAGTSYKVSCTITTSASETKTDWFYVTVI